MKKEMYERSELEIIKFRTQDVIMATGEPEEDELPYVPNPNH